MRRLLTIIAAQVIAVSGLSAEGKGMTLGEFEYKNSCAQCHGDSGKGDGPYGANLKSPPSDLTVLQKQNNGVFPVAKVFSIIEGTTEVRLHGLRDMPLWGRRFRTRVTESEEEFSRLDPNEYATTRILALIEYLATLQAK